MSDKQSAIGGEVRPTDDPSKEEGARRVELLAGIKKGAVQALRGKGVSIEEARRLGRDRAHR